MCTVFAAVNAPPNSPGTRDSAIGQGSNARDSRQLECFGSRYADWEKGERRNKTNDCGLEDIVSIVYIVSFGEISRLREGKGGVCGLWVCRRRARQIFLQAADILSRCQDLDFFHPTFHSSTFRLSPSASPLSRADT